uniref:Ig-like domain-containing protein n=1 Tax=Esox lucius TaxID=8010 RepID=A0A3P8Y2A5_ESOLU
MKKTEIQMTLKKGADEGMRSVPSPIIPPKRAKANPNHGQPAPDSVAYAFPSQTPPIFVRKMRNAAVGTGCDIRLKVAVAGDPQPSLYWYHNDDLLNMDNQEYGGLWIRDCKPSDAGLYTCIANNYLGEARSSAVLAVLDLGEDSETTEDEGGDPVETKEGSRGLQDQALHSEDRMMDSWGEGLQEISKPTRSKSEDFLRESPPQALPPPSPKIIKRPSNSPMPSRSGSAPNTPLTPRKKVVVPTDYQDTVPSEFEEKVKHPKSSAMSQSSNQDSRPQTPVSVTECSRKEHQSRPSPKLTRASSKIFEKVRGFEEKRRSYDHEGSISGRSWAGFNRAGSVDSDDAGSRLGISRESSREDLREALKEEAAERRSMFKQRAASLEDCRPRTTQKVQEIENKFTEELQRIKKLVGKPHMKKSFSTEQLSLRARGRQPLTKIEPLPPQILQKLQERERARQEKEQKEAEQPIEVAPPKSPRTPLQEQARQRQPSPLPEEIEHPSMSSITISRLGEVAATPESMQLADLPGQRPTRQVNQVSPVREIVQRSPSPAKMQIQRAYDLSTNRQQRAESPNRNVVEMTLRKVERRPESPLVQRVSRMQESQDIQASPAQKAPKEELSGRKTPVEVALRKIEHRPESPLIQKKATMVQERPTQPPQNPPRLVTSSANVPVPQTEEKMEVELTKSAPRQAPKLSIPTIIVEEEPMEGVPIGPDMSKKANGSKGGQTQRTRGKGRRTRPMSPDLDSSDDSYVSAEEDPLEAPLFEFPLKDTVVTAGTEVLLRVIIVGTPLPEVTWRRDNIEILNSPYYAVKVEGEQYSLLIKCTKPSDAGMYCVTAANEAGKASSSATLSIIPEPVQEPQGNLGVPRDISSPITSDEEYLSPLEEGMDFGGSNSREIVDTRFKEPPAFQVTMNDQAVIEGQEVTMSVRISGQPKPMLYWLRDRVTIKTDLRHTVREAEDGTFEMTIKSAQKSDTGVYTCKIINEYGTKQCESKLEVKGTGSTVVGCIFPSP